MKGYSIVSLVIQLVLISSCLYFWHKADEALDKAGIGDVEVSNQFTHYGFITLFSWFILWVFTIILISMKGSFSDSHSQLCVGLTPIFLISGWLSLWFV